MPISFVRKSAAWSGPSLIQRRLRMCAFKNRTSTARFFSAHAGFTFTALNWYAWMTSIVSPSFVKPRSIAISANGTLNTAPPIAPLSSAVRRGPRPPAPRRERHAQPRAAERAALEGREARRRAAGDEREAEVARVLQSFALQIAEQDRGRAAGEARDAKARAFPVFDTFIIFSAPQDRK